MKQAIHLILLFAVLALTGCSKGEPADWNMLRNQANELYNGQQFEEALALYKQALECADADGRLTLQQDIIDCHLAKGEAEEARKLLRLLMKEAHDSGNIHAMAEANYTLGEQLYKAGNGKKGFEYMQEAVRLMEQEMKVAQPDKLYDVGMTLAYYHHGLMKWYCTDGDYPRTLAHAKAIQRVVELLADDEQTRKFRRIALSMQAYTYMLTDSVAQAEVAYRQWQQLLPCLNQPEERDICPYYMESGHYREALEIYSRYEQFVLENMGYWSSMERLVCRNVAEIYNRMGLPDSAYNRLLKAYEIRDTLYARQAVANAQELEAVYQNQQKTEQISRQRVWIVTLAAVLAVLLVAIGLNARTRLVRKRKDRAMAAVVRDMIASPNSSKGGDTQIHDTMGASVETDNQTSSSWEGLGEANRFTAFDAAVDCGRLFAKPEVTRDVLVELMGTDSTTFSRIIREQSGCQNLNYYLNRKRIRLACQLLHEHADWTIDAIAQDSGFRSVRTFNHVFKSLCGTTPSAYQQQVAGSEKTALS